MAGNIKGIIVEIGGDTSGLQKALESVNKSTKTLTSELRGINTLLEFDPKNTTLLAQKQQVLKQTISETAEKVKVLKEAQESYVKSGGDLNTEQYRNLQREIINTERKLKDLQVQASKWTSASKSLKNFSTSIGNIGSTITTVGQKFMGLTATIGAGVVASIKYNSEMETLATNLKVLLGNEQKAQNMLKTLKEMASTTPFETSDLVNATQTLLSFGVQADNVNNILKMLGDVSMGNSEKLSSLALVFGQISSNGKLMGQDLLQLINAGFNPLQVLSESTGTSMEKLKDKMSKGKIGIEEVTKAFQIATSEGGTFYKGMEEGSKTLAGKASTALDGFKEALGSLTESFLPLITDALEKLTDLIDKFNALDDETKKSVATFALMAGAIAPVLIVFGSLFSAISKISAGISVFAGWVPKIVTSLKGLGAVFSTINLPLTLIITAITALVAGFIYLWNTNEGFRNAVINAWNKIKETLVTIFTAIGEFFTVTIPQWIQNVQDWFANLPYNIGYAFGQLLAHIVNFGYNAWNWVKTEVPKIIEGIIEWFKKLPGKIWDWLKNTLEKFSNWFTDMLDTVKEKLPKVIESIVNFFKELPGKMIEIGRNIIEGLWNRYYQCQRLANG